MKSIIASVLFPFILLLGGCVNPNAGYIKQHPELTAAQQNMFLERKVYPGTDVAGLTKAQIRKIMGAEPISQEGDAWIYKKLFTRAITNLAPQLGNSMAAQMGVGVDPSDPNSVRGFVVTTIFFKGDVATHAERSFERKTD